MLNFFVEEPSRARLQNANLPAWQDYDLSPDYHRQHLQEWANLYTRDSGFARTLIQAQTLAYLRTLRKGPKAVFHSADPLPNTLQVNPRMHTPRATRMSVKAIDCLYAAEEFVKQGKRVAVLNMANQFNPGGGYLYGAGAQEEDLCRRTNLITTLDPSLYQVQAVDQEGRGFGEHNTLYSDKVKVFRNGKDKNYTFLNAQSQFDISVISSAAYNLGHSQVNPTSERYRKGMENKIIMQLETALQHGHRNLVLSAFGCGAFANDPKVVSQIYKKVLFLPRYQNAFDHVVFAIVPNPGAANDNYAPFRNTFVPVQPTPNNQFPMRLALSLIPSMLLVSALPITVYAAVTFALGAAFFLCALSYLMFPVTNGKGINRREHRSADHTQVRLNPERNYLPRRQRKSVHVDGNLDHQEPVARKRHRIRTH